MTKWRTRGARSQLEFTARHHEFTRSRGQWNAISLLEWNTALEVGITSVLYAQRVRDTFTKTEPCRHSNLPLGLNKLPKEVRLPTDHSDLSLSSDLSFEQHYRGRDYLRALCSASTGYLY